jgi:hypothetical protein
MDQQMDQPGANGEHVRMARAHGIALVVTIAVGAGLWVWAARDDSGQAPPPAQVQAPGSHAAGKAPVDTAVARQALPPVDAPRPSEAPTTTPPAPDDAPVAEAAAVDLQVRDAATKAPIAAFRWRFRPAEGAGDQRKGNGTAGAAGIALPAGARGELFVEAEGYQPESRPVQVPAVVGAPQQLALFLARTQARVGVTLVAHDDQSAPVARLRLELWQLAPAAADPPAGTDPAEQPLWSRMGTGDNGTFHLPDLPVGRLALRAQPVDEHGDALPLLPWRAVFAFGGVEAVDYAVDFQPGIALVLTADDDRQQALDLGCTVRNRAGEPVPVVWRSRRDERSTASLAADLVTLPGRATCALALPLGDYTLELAHGDATFAATATGGEGRMRTFTARVPR